MKNRTVLFLSLMVAFALAPRARGLALFQADVPASNFADPQLSGEKAREEDEEYSGAQDELNEGQYSDAARSFDKVARMHGRKADAAIYWKAYSLNKTGNRAQALATIGELKKGYPQSKY